MLVPAIVYKDELIKQFDLLRYSEKAMYFNGCIEFGRLNISDEASEGRFQFAIVEEKIIEDEDKNEDIEEEKKEDKEIKKTTELIGYLGFYVDFYASGVWGVGLISFKDKPSWVITNAVKEMITMIESYNPHRVEFRAIEGNPAVKAYDKIRTKYAESFMWDVNKFVLKDTFRDRQGKFRDSYIYEFVRREHEDRWRFKG